MTDPNLIFKKGVYRETASDDWTDEERRWAKNLLRGDNLERLTNANRTGRRFRPVPVSIHYAYWWVKGSDYVCGGWRMERVENGKRTDHHYTGDIATEVNRLKAAGFTVREIRMDGAPSLHSPRQRGKRKSFADRFGGFDPETYG